MIRYTDYKPRIIPVLGAGTWDEIDRVQSVDKTGTVNRIEVEEVGRDGVVGYVEDIPAVAYRMVQNEYGSLAFFNSLANLADNNTVIDLNDFKTSTFDICSYKNDDDGSFKGTNWIPKLRLAGFSVNIGSPKSLLVRNFDFVGEDWIDWQGDNKYLIYKEETVESGEIGSGGLVEITISDPTAEKDPNSESGEDIYILRVVRIRSEVSTELVADTDYSYDAGTLSVLDCEAGDLIKYWYTASSYISGKEDEIFVPNNVVPGIHANSASIYLESGNYLYRLQSANLDVRFDRQDEGEIGNDEIVQRGIRNKTVTITLDRNLEDLTIEELVSGKSPDYGKLDIRKFSDNLTLRIYIYSSSAKSAFLIGFKCTGLAPSEIRGGVSVGNYTGQGNTLIGKACIISDVKAQIDS